MMNPEAVEIWRQYQAETDPESQELLYQAYLRALQPIDLYAIASRPVPPEQPPKFRRA